MCLDSSFYWLLCNSVGFWLAGRPCVIFFFGLGGRGGGFFSQLCGISKDAFGDIFYDIFYVQPSSYTLTSYTIICTVRYLKCMYMYNYMFKKVINVNIYKMISDVDRIHYNRIFCVHSLDIMYTELMIYFSENHTVI